MWKIIPKRKFVQLTTLRLGAYLAVLQYNEPPSYIEEILKDLNIKPGSAFEEGLKKMTSHKKEGNKKKRSGAESDSDTEDADYSAGAF